VAWLPDDFVHPLRVDIDENLHLRPISPDDTEIDMIAVMGSQARLFSLYGEAWGWPPVDMTAEADRADLQRHADEMVAHESFNYAILDAGETAILGCIYIDPPEDETHGAIVSWWVIDALVGTPAQAAVDAFVPRWLAEEWPLERIRFGV